MIEKQVKVKLKNGLHARPAGELIRKIKPYESSVYLIKDNRNVNLKSIIQVMTVAIKENEIIDISIEGEDEEQVVKVIEEFFERPSET